MVLRNRSAVLLAIAAGLVVGACTSGASPSPSVQLSPSAAPSQAAMTVVLQGDLRGIDGEASGLAELVQLADGSYEVVLDQFSIAAIDHISVVLSPSPNVEATTDVDPDLILDLGPLKAAEGMQSYPIPADMAGDAMTAYPSVIIWDTAMLHAIAAATLE
jgi:hypothetical protein